MCGIFGYVGRPRDVGSVVLEGLRRLEYRGYDSWGVAVRAGDALVVEKRTGAIGTARVALPETTIGFGHTRWATHGRVTVANAHPHLDCTGRFAVIHNGIVDNFRPLRDELTGRGHTFHSATDSEVVAHLLEEAAAGGADLAAALRAAFGRLEGFNAVIVLDRDREELAAVKTISPLVLGVGADAVYVASDALALAPHTRDVVYLEDRQLAVLTRAGVTVTALDGGAAVPLRVEHLAWEAEEADLGGYPDFLSKEIAEQPRIIRALADDVAGGAAALAAAIGAARGSFLVGCGTAAHAAVTGQYLFSRIARRHVNAVLGSEFKYQEHFLTAESLVVALSQSGETADIIEAVVTSRARGARIGALVNVRGSSLERTSDLRVLLGAGPEQSVLSTKAYTAKLAVLTLAAHHLADTPEEGRAVLRRAATAIEGFLAGPGPARVAAIAARLAAQPHLYVIGRGLSYPTALEAALKVKEASYVHAEGFAGGELKHGVIALIAPGTPCLVFAPADETRADILASAQELQARGAWIVGVGPDDDPVFDEHLAVPSCGDADPLALIVPAQLLARETARCRGLDPDRPRNLAKSVTVK